VGGLHLLFILFFFHSLSQKLIPLSPIASNRRTLVLRFHFLVFFFHLSFFAICSMFIRARKGLRCLFLTISVAFSFFLSFFLYQLTAIRAMT